MRTFWAALSIVKGGSGGRFSIGHPWRLRAPDECAKKRKGGKRRLSCAAAQPLPLAGLPHALVEVAAVVIRSRRHVRRPCFGSGLDRHGRLDAATLGPSEGEPAQDFNRHRRARRCNVREGGGKHAHGDSFLVPSVELAV